MSDTEKHTARASLHVSAWLVMWMWAAACIGLSTAALAVESGATSDVTGGAPAALDKQAVEKWSDHLFKRMLDEYRISAGTIAVTQGDDVILTKAYGYSDWRTGEKADAVSEFRIASLSKTFLATAVAQLLERGLIKTLDDPVNLYLKRLVIAPFNGKHVTIRDLVTHTGGFGRTGTIPNDPRPHAPLTVQMIIDTMPPVVREPGTLSIYCNACNGVLGIMVEDLTGELLADYMQTNIFGPLGMQNSYLENTGKPGSRIVTQFAFAPGQAPLALPYPASGSPYTYASGAINSTADDMAKWLISNIQQGNGSGPKLVKPETYQLLHTRQRGNHPQTNGFGMGFFSYPYEGEHVLEHYGSITFRSLQLMLLNRKIGVFISVAGGGPIKDLKGMISGEAIAVDALVMAAASHSGMRASILEYFLGPLTIPNQEEAYDLSKLIGNYDRIQEDPNVAPAEGAGIQVVLSEDHSGLYIGEYGVYRPISEDTVVLDGTLPLEAGFSVGNRYSFAWNQDGVLQMFPHINAGGYQRRPEK